MQRRKHRKGIARGVRIACLVFVAVLLPSAHGQDISGYVIAADKDIFLRESASDLSATPAGILPILDCSVEYIRRYEGRDITYRRGPVPLAQTTPVISMRGATSASEPASEEEIAKRYFTGGMLVDLPRAGETINYLSSSDESKRYMIRVSILPLSYTNDVLQARVLL